MVGTLLLFAIGFVAWALIYHIGLFYVNVNEGTPQVTVASSILLLNNGNLSVIELQISDQGYGAFNLESVSVFNSTVLSSTISPSAFYTTFSQVSTGTSSSPVTISSAQPFLVRQGTTATLYAIVHDQGEFSGAQTFIVQLTGTIGSSTFTFQSSAQVVS